MYLRSGKTIQMANSTSKIKQLTFGVEIECILAFPHSKHQEPPPDIQAKKIRTNRDLYSQRNKCIREPLRRAGLQVSPATEDFARTYRSWFVKADSSVDFTESDFVAAPMRCSNGFAIQRYQDMDYCSVELVSPILPLTIPGLEEVRIAVLTLRKQCILLSNSAALHVHIGDDARGFSLPLLQNLVVLTSCFEQQWNQAHPVARLFSSYCRLPRESFRVQQQRNRRSMAGVIYALTSVGDLIDKMHLPRERYDVRPRPEFYHERGRVVNYLNLRGENGGDVKRTVEFRQHAGTIDEFEILRWIVTVGAVVQLANDLPAEAFLETIDAH